MIRRILIFELGKRVGETLVEPGKVTFELDAEGDRPTYRAWRQTSWRGGRVVIDGVGYGTLRSDFGTIELDDGVPTPHGGDATLQVLWRGIVAGGQLP